jgi:hypothetical protein
MKERTSGDGQGATARSRAGWARWFLPTTMTQQLESTALLPKDAVIT